MNKKAYMAPEMEVVKMKINAPLLQASMGEGQGGTGQEFGDDVQPG